MALFNVLDPTYGAKGDAVRVLDGVTANGSNLVDSATANFQAGDVGKVIWANDPTGVGATLPKTTISNRISATRVQVAAPATVNGAGQCLVFGTDDTAAFQAAFAAALAAYRGGSVTGLIEAPSAGYILSARWYRNNGGGVSDAAKVAGPSVRGDGVNQTQFYLAPDFTVPGAGTGVLMENIGYGAEWSGLMVDGCYATLATAAGQHLLSIAQAQSFKAATIIVRNIGLGAGSFMFNFEGGRQCLVSDILCQNLGVYGGGGAIGVDNTFGTFVQCFASNTIANLRLSNINGRDPISTPFTWIGGGSDEGGTPAVSLVNATVAMKGIVNFGGIDPPSVAFDVDSNSSLFIEDSNVGRFLGYAGQSRPLNNRGLVVSKGTTWRGNASPPGSPVAFMVNPGIFVDVGGNKFRRYSADAVFTDAIPTTRDCFLGNNPKVNGSWSASNQVARL